MTAYQMLVAFHGAIGVVALAAFWGAAALRKGSVLHRRVGQIYLIAMAGIVVTALPLAAAAFARGKPVIGVFLAYLVVITATGTWSAWRAIRDKHDVACYTGPVYVALAWLSLLSGVGSLAFGIRTGMPLLIGFSAVGLFTGQDMLRKRRNRVAFGQQPRWWLVEHYTAMLGNGIATHIAFLGIGLPRLLPSINGEALHYLSWFGPLAVALVAKVLVDRRWKPRPKVGVTARASTV
ncbi:hypothetical protein [Montanilutibacter psychrotolerans]|uniref:DUF2306 domain-containing protein n=1 Tax=Montanilutibacter psychrotolerans TaxID=1327343 RepID=A0A3M8SQT9_9GAMM|nr:hypothetical protein [Lysobacter psychrotolerans]RNF83698.1 hypothetical protein EER27_09980 [Lysobacter psychrotolerans]